MTTFEPGASDVLTHGLERRPPVHHDAAQKAAAVAQHLASRVVVTLADGTEIELDHGHVVIAAITSCTNTSNPTVMVAAGLLARNAVARGLRGGSFEAGGSEAGNDSAANSIVAWRSSSSSRGR